MRKLYRIDHSVTYWVIATDPADAIVQAHNWELAAGNTETETLGEAAPIEMARRDAELTRFQLDGEDETCSMWLAYMLVRDHASTVIACSEW